MRIDCVLPDGTKKKTDAILEILLDPKLQTSAEQMKTVEEVWSYLQKGVRVDNTKNASDGGAVGTAPGSPLAAAFGNLHEDGGRQGGADPLAPIMEVPNLTNNENTINRTGTTTTGGSTGTGTTMSSDLTYAEARTTTALQAVEHISMVNKEQEEANKSAPWGITLELLQTQFSKHLKDAATDLGVGSTTLKRICRQYGIARWPRRSLKSKQNKACLLYTSPSPRDS